MTSARIERFTWDRPLRTRRTTVLSGAGMAMLSSLLAGSLQLGGCSKTPYREVLREMSQPLSVRMHDRVAEVSKQYEAALEQFEATDKLLTGHLAVGSALTEWELYRCRDSVELCDWWAFELERATISIADLVSDARHAGAVSSLSGSDDAGASRPDGDAEFGESGRYLHLVAEFEQARQILVAISAEYLEIVEALVAGSASPPAPPDLRSLREVVTAAVLNAEGLTEVGGSIEATTDEPG